MISFIKNNFKSYKLLFSKPKLFFPLVLFLLFPVLGIVSHFWIYKFIINSSTSEIFLDILNVWVVNFSIFLLISSFLLTLIFKLTFKIIRPKEVSLFFSLEEWVRFFIFLIFCSILFFIIVALVPIFPLVILFLASLLLNFVFIPSFIIDRRVSIIKAIKKNFQLIKVKRLISLFISVVPFLVVLPFLWHTYRLNYGPGILISKASFIYLYFIWIVFGFGLFVVILRSVIIYFKQIKNKKII